MSGTQRFLTGTGIIDTEYALGLIANDGIAARKLFVELLNRDETIEILEAVLLLKESGILPKNHLTELFQQLDYDFETLQGHNLPDYFLNLRTLIIEIIRAHLSINTRYLSKQFKVSERYLFDLYKKFT